MTNDVNMRGIRTTTLGVPALGLLICVAAALPVGCNEKPPEARSRAPGDQRPNVLLISIDTLRADHLHCYGYARPTSPRLDRLATQGVLFEQAISSTSWTLPAHAAMLTGLADTVHGAVDTDRPLDGNRATLAERLSDAGYVTAGFFSGPYLHPVFGLAQGFDTYVDCTSYPRLIDEKARDQRPIEGPDMWRHANADVTNPRLTREVVAWLEESTQLPFFLFVHMWDVHFDFVPPPPFDTMFDPDYAGDITGENFFFNPRVRPGMPEEDLRHLIALYDGEIAWTDQHVGKILDKLDELGLSDETLVIVTSDHGTAFFEHGERAHRNGLYEELIHVPLIMRLPDVIPARLRVSEQVRLIDILPTVTELAELPASDDVMGQSLAPAFRGAPLERDEPAVSELFTLGQQLRSYRRVEHKLIYNEGSGGGLVFDLLEDPGEQDPIRDSDAPQVRAALDDRAWALDWLSRWQTALPVGMATPDIPPDVMQRLEALGYVGDRDEFEDDEEPARRSIPGEPESRGDGVDAPATQPASRPTTRTGDDPADP